MKGGGYAIKILIVLVLMYFAFVDCKKKCISKWPLILLSIIVAICTIVVKELSIIEMIGGITVGFIMILISLLTKQKLGLGDGILITIMGAFLGFQTTLLMILYALTVSAIYSMILLVIKHVNRQYRIPFIPFILIGYIGVII